jgi:hypothetical protein
MQWPQPIRAGILAVVVPVVLFADSSLQQLWDARLSEKLTEPAGWTAARGHPIIALAFSPDGRRLAATMDSHFQDRVHKTHLLIVDVESPQAGFRQFDLETCGKYLAWSPDGGAPPGLWPRTSVGRWKFLRLAPDTHPASGTRVR